MFGSDRVTLNCPHVIRVDLEQSHETWTLVCFPSGPVDQEHREERDKHHREQKPRQRQYKNTPKVVSRPNFLKAPMKEVKHSEPDQT